MSPDAMLACWSRLDVSEFVYTYAMKEVLAKSPRSTIEDSQLSFGCMDSSRTTHLIMNAIRDRGDVPLPAAAQAPHRTKAWPRSRLLDPQEWSSSGLDGRPRADDTPLKICTYLSLSFSPIPPYYCRASLKH